MKRPPEIQINQFQLVLLLNDEEKKSFEMVIADNVFCSHCGGVARAGISINEMFLTNLNDILVKGTCNTCNGKVARIMEFGESKEFYNKAMGFRNSISN